MKEKSSAGATIARKRFENYLDEKLTGAWDSETWEFYTFLLKQAQNHQVDMSGHLSAEYQQDVEKAKTS
jgi:hypothetical protein